jgi:hypothetical protein
MNKILLFLSFCLFISYTSLDGQTVILDFEADTTSRQFQYFGSTLDGTLSNVIANPDASGINTSAMVADHVKPAGSESWAGAWANPGPTTDLTVNTEICVDVWFSSPGNMALKLENGDKPNWVIQVDVTDTMQWTQICFNTALPSIEAPFEAADGGVFNGLVVFFDFGQVLAEETTYYFDNIITRQMVIPKTVILDFETDTTSRQFQYFGSTLDGTLNNIIANPDPSGINTSPMVADFVKPANSEVWAGAWANPGPTTDLTNYTDICVDVWFNSPGNLALKLENGDKPNWILQVDVADTMQWTQVCFNTKVPSIEAPFETADGGIFNGLVMFFDFGMSLADSALYYFDNVVTQPGSVGTAEISFSVDMNSYSNAFTTVYVSGTFNNWSGDANPLSDDDSDGVWTGMISGIDIGAHEFKFSLDNWTASEQFNGNETCTIVDQSGNNVNRRLLVAADEVLPTFCYNSCYACGEAIMITVNLGQGSVVPSEEGFYIAGGGNFGNPGDFKLIDSDGDGVHSATFERPIGFESFYTFTNGACGDFSCKENIGGQDCANPDNFNDRHMGPFTEDAVISTCFGLCTTDTECGGAAGGTVTFYADMTEYSGAFTTPFISGNFNGWSGDSNPMTDADGDGVWTGSIELVAGSYEYKIQLDGWAVQEEFTAGDPCTVTNGGYTNRSLSVANEDFSVCYKWNTCDTCTVATGLNQLNVDNSIFKAQPTLVVTETNLIFGDNFTSEKEVNIFNAYGQLVRTIDLQSGMLNYRLDMSDIGTGLYLINVVTEGKQQTLKILIAN